MPGFFIDCKYAEKDIEEKAAFEASFENILTAAKIKTPYDPKSATAAKPMNVRLEEENNILE